MWKLISIPWGKSGTFIICLFPPKAGETDRVRQSFLGKEVQGPPASVTAGGGLVVGPTESESLEVTQETAF